MTPASQQQPNLAPNNDGRTQNMSNKLHSKRILLPLAIIIGTVILAIVISSNPPQAERRAPSKAPQMTVEVQPLEAQMYQVNIDSFGTVQPLTETQLVSQVTGQIVYINDNFRQGGFFEKDEVLVKVDDRDYRSDVKIAEASLLDAQQALTEEQARAEQALTDWKRLGKTGQPNALVLRKPQLEAAKARLFSAEAQLEKAKLKLERTQVVAPYAGRVLSQNVDLGQVISANSQLATIYATDSVEIRLPIKNQDLPLIELPESYRHDKVNHEGNKARVTFTSTFADDHVWQGQLVRTEGAIDSTSQQLYVVAQIEDPYRQQNQQNIGIKIGQYLTAKIAGRLMPNSIVIPNNAVYQGTYVYVVEENLLKRRNIELLWKNETQAIVKSGLNIGEQLVITPLGRVSSGTPVSVSGQNKAFAKDQQERGKTLADLPEKRQQRIREMAKAQGISAEQMFEQLKSQRQQGKDKQALNTKQQSENAS